MDMSTFSRLVLKWTGVSFDSFVDQYRYDSILKVSTNVDRCVVRQLCGPV